MRKLTVLASLLLIVSLSGSGIARADEVTGDDVYRSSSEVEAQAAEKGYEFPSPSAVGAATLDILVLRPLGFLSSGIGLAAFVLSTPFVAPSLDFRTPWEVFVVAPSEYTFVRPIGDF